MAVHGCIIGGIAQSKGQRGKTAFFLIVAGMLQS